VVDRLFEGGERKKLAILAHHMRTHPAQLRADFQRYYGLNLDGMGTDYTVLHAADLAACLPRESLCGIAEDPINEWNIDRLLLGRIEFWLHSWLWAHTKDGKRKVNKPKLLIPTPDGDDRDVGEVERMTLEDMNAFLDSLKAGGGHGNGVDDGVHDADAEAV
jgi:hypothetical protein